MGNSVRGETEETRFRNIDEILGSEFLDTAEKRRRLVGLKDAILHRLDASNEGMPPNGSTDRDMARLEAVERAIEHLGSDPDEQLPFWRRRAAQASKGGSLAPRG